MTYFVYILYSKKDAKLYTGCTSNLISRIKAHDSGGVEATKNRRPLVLIYSEKYSLKSEAYARERFLKTKWGNSFKRRVKRFYVNKVGHVENMTEHFSPKRKSVLVARALMCEAHNACPVIRLWRSDLGDDWL